MDKGRPGKRTREQLRSEMLKRATSSQSRYSIGGIKKEGRNAPKPVTLAKLNLPPIADE